MSMDLYERVKEVVAFKGLLKEEHLKVFYEALDSSDDAPLTLIARKWQLTDDLVELIIAKDKNYMVFLENNSFLPEKYVKECFTKAKRMRTKRIKNLFASPYISREAALSYYYNKANLHRYDAIRNPNITAKDLTTILRQNSKKPKILAEQNTKAIAAAYNKNFNDEHFEIIQNYREVNYGSLTTSPYITETALSKIYGIIKSSQHPLYDKEIIALIGLIRNNNTPYNSLEGIYKEYRQYVGYHNERALLFHKNAGLGLVLQETVMTLLDKDHLTDACVMLKPHFKNVAHLEIFTALMPNSTLTLGELFKQTKLLCG